MVEIRAEMGVVQQPNKVDFHHFLKRQWFHKPKVMEYGISL